MNTTTLTEPTVLLADMAPGRAGTRAPLPARAEPRIRGCLVLAEKVIEKIASRAAVEAGATSGRTGRVLGIGAADPDATPRVEVELSAVSADLALKVGIAYPGSIRAATQQVRDHVTRRVEQLTGVDVRRVDIDVTLLHIDRDDVPRTLR